MPEESSRPTNRRLSRAGDALPTKIRAFLPLAADIVIPAVAYVILTALGLRPVWALTAAGVLTGLHTAWTTIRRGRLNGIGALIAVELALTVGLFFVTDDPRMVALKPSFYTALAAGYLYVSCFVGRPIVYEAATPLATDGDPERLVAYGAAWENSAPFRARERAITAVFGTALLAEAILRAVVILSSPASEVGRTVLTGQVPGVLLIAAALVFTKLQVPALQRIVDAEQARLRGVTVPAPAGAPTPTEATATQSA